MCACDHTFLQAKTALKAIPVAFRDFVQKQI